MGVPSADSRGGERERAIGPRCCRQAGLSPPLPADHTLAAHSQPRQPRARRPLSPWWPASPASAFSGTDVRSPPLAPAPHRRNMSPPVRMAKSLRPVDPIQTARAAGRGRANWRLAFTDQPAKASWRLPAGSRASTTFLVCSSVCGPSRSQALGCSRPRRWLRMAKPDDGLAWLFGTSTLHHTAEHTTFGDGGLRARRLGALLSAMFSPSVAQLPRPPQPKAWGPDPPRGLSPSLARRMMYKVLGILGVPPRP